MNEKTKKFINLKSITIAAVLIALLAIGSAIAFFTDKDNKTNDFTVGNISIQLTEPNWNADSSSFLCREYCCSICCSRNTDRDQKYSKYRWHQY